MKLSFERPELYRMKRGQTLWDVAEAFCLPPRVIAACNFLESPPEEGTVLKIPPAEGNLYTVRGGESKSLLCGSPRAFEEKNKTAAFYPGQVVLI